MAYEIPVTQARAELADLINRVVYGGERVVVTRHGKPSSPWSPPPTWSSSKPSRNPWTSR